MSPFAPRLVFVCLASSAGALPGAAGTPLPPVGNDAWHAVEIPGVERGTSYQVHREEGRRVLRAESDCGASGTATELDDVDARETPVLQWRWRIEKGLDVEDERSKAGDDFAARVIVMFQYDPSQASWLERAQHAVAERLRGEELPGRSLAYVWSSRQPPGEAWRNPYRSPTVLISRGRGTSSPWRTASADVLRDYEKHWQAEPPPLAGLALLTDADNTCSRAVAHYADFRFVARKEAQAGARSDAPLGNQNVASPVEVKSAPTPGATKSSHAK